MEDSFHKFWHYYCYFYHLTRSKITYVLILESWLIFSVILILLTFQLHFFLIHLQCQYEPDNDILIDDSMEQTIIDQHEIFELKQCEWDYDHQTFLYDNCVSEKEYNMLSWMSLIIFICLILHIFYLHFDEFCSRIIQKITKFDKLKYNHLQNEIEIFFKKWIVSKEKDLTEIVDKITYKYNDKILLPTEIRHIIVAMIHDTLPKCQKCDKIICQHIQDQNKKNMIQDSKELEVRVDDLSLEIYKMKIAKYLANSEMTIEIMSIYVILISLIGTFVYGFCWMINSYHFFVFTTATVLYTFIQEWSLFYY